MTTIADAGSWSDLRDGLWAKMDHGLRFPGRMASYPSVHVCKDIIEFLLYLILNPNLLDCPTRQKTVLVIVLNILKQLTDLLIFCF